MIRSGGSESVECGGVSISVSFGAPRTIKNSGGRSAAPFSTDQLRRGGGFGGWKEGCSPDVGDAKGINDVGFSGRTGPLHQERWRGQVIRREGKRSFDFHGVARRPTELLGRRSAAKGELHDPSFEPPRGKEEDEETSQKKNIKRRRW